MSTSNTHPRTPAQIEASRANGAKSHGATTPEGKAATCGKRMTHGFRSNCITLSTEDQNAYDDHLDAYLARYTPADKTEQDLVGLLAANMWQIMRNNSIEVALFELEISGVAFHIEGKFEDMDQYGILALAFKKFAGDNAFELPRRYRTTAERAYHRAFQALEQIQKDRKSQPPAPPEILSAVQTREPAIDHALNNTPQPEPLPTLSKEEASQTKNAQPFLVVPISPQGEIKAPASETAEDEIAENEINADRTPDHDDPTRG